MVNSIRRIDILATRSEWPKVQLSILLVVSIYFSMSNVAIAAIYGGIIGLLNTSLINRYINKQKGKLNISPGTVVIMMSVSVIMRMILLVLMTFFGLLIVGLAPEALIIGLVLGQIGFLIDRVINR